MRLYMNGPKAMGPLNPMPRVWPSGAALATTSMPSMPPAPALFSTVSGWPQRAASFSPRVRTMMSSELPAGAGTTTRTGLSGQPAAKVAGAAAARPRHSIRGRSRRFIGEPPGRAGPPAGDRSIVAPGWARQTRQRVEATPASFHPLLLQLARQRAPVQAQAPRGLADVETGLGQGLVDALPLQRLEGGRAVAQGEVGLAFLALEGGLDVVGVGRLGEVVARAELDGLDRGGDAGEAGQHDDGHGRVVTVQRLHAGQARAAVGELEVDHRVRGRVAGQQGLHALEVGGTVHLPAAALEGAAQRGGQRVVVLDDQQAAVVVGAGGGTGAGRRGGGQVGVHRVGAPSSASRRSAASGSSMLTSPPPYSGLRAVTLPPSLRATFTLRKMPSPPPGLPL